MREERDVTVHNPFLLVNLYINLGPTYDMILFTLIILLMDYKVISLLIIIVTRRQPKTDNSK